VAAASGLKSAVLELGGKSASIVFPDRGSDTARQVANGIFGSTGQTCVAGSRLLVHEDIHDEFVAEVVSHAKSKRMGDPLDETTELAPMATRPQYERVMAYIREAMEQGAHLAYGGNQSTDGSTPGGLFIEPTIFTHVTPEMTIANEEIFGPVLSVIPFRDEEEAVRIANSVCFGLAAGVWTADLRRAHRLARQLQAGTVWINTYRVNAPQMPVGGYKNSGVGRESGDEAIKEYLQMKSVWIDVQ
jgi:aldehyde dehydrogenase (NAD+)